MTSNRRRNEQELFFERLRTFGADEWRAALGAGQEEAALWTEAAAKYGIVDAQLYWAQMLLDGRGVPPDAEAAFRWFAIAAKSQRADAINMLGRCHELGWGVPRNPAEAALLYQAAASKGDDWAKFNLAGLLLDGVGVARDVDEAFRLYLAAADRGHAKAMTMVARFFLEGWGRAPDPALAGAWLQRASDSGDFRADYHLGRIALQAGEIETAAEWFARAIEHATIAFCGDVAPSWFASPYPAIKAVGLRAFERACEAGGVSDLRAYALALQGAAVSAEEQAAAKEAWQHAEALARALERKAAVAQRQPKAGIAAKLASLGAALTRSRTQASS